MNDVLMQCQIWFAHILLRIFASLLVRDVDLSFFVLCCIFVWFWSQSNAELIKKEFGRVPFFSILQNSFKRVGGNSSLNVLQDSVAVRSWTFHRWSSLVIVSTSQYIIFQQSQYIGFMQETNTHLFEVFQFVIIYVVVVSLQFCGSSCNFPFSTLILFI